MKAVVLYSTRTGNTEKVAREIAAELSCPCMKVTDDTAPPAIALNGYDMVFVGTGIYRGQPSPQLLGYLNNAPSKSGRKFALFTTCFGWGKEICDANVVGAIRGAVESKDQRFLADRFSCFGGGLGFVKRGHPDVAELAAARKWAKDICSMP